MNSTRTHILRVLFFSTSLLVPASIKLWAQVAGTGVIQGTITDPSGATVAGATVTATELTTGAKLTRASTDSGFYVLSPLAPGHYTVSVTSSGFQTSVHEHIAVNALSVVDLNIGLEVGQASQHITVSSAPPALESANATLGVTITNEAYTSLPLAMNGGPKSPEGFIYLLPGVQAGSGFAGNINGGVAFSKEIYVNGLSINTPVLNGDPRNLTTATSIELVDQFQIETNGAPAYYQGQGIENFVYKSGSNQFHGDAYEYLRNTVLDSRGFFAATTPQEVQNEFGGTVGGPIVKNRLFFFGAYDGYRIRSGAVPSFYSIPTSAEQQGNFSALPTQIYNPYSTTCSANGSCTRAPFAGNIIPTSLISPVSQSFQSYLPGTMNSNLQNNILSAFNGGTNQNDFTIKIDAATSDKNHLFGLVQWGKNYPVRLSANGAPQLPLPYGSSRYADTITEMAQFSDSYVISPNLVNVFGFSFNRFNNPYTNPTTGGSYVSKSGLTGVPAGQASDVFPPIAFLGPDAPTDWAEESPSVSFYEITNTDVFQDNIQWVRGNHSMTFGGQVLLWQDNNELPTTGTVFDYINFSNNETAGFNPVTGSLNTNTGNAYASFLLGAVDAAQLVQNSAGETGARWQQYGVWFQDDWKVTKRLTLNLGLRWDLFTPYVEQYNRASWFNPSLPNPAVDNYPGALQFAGNGTDSCNCRTRVQDFYKNFGPRLGLAYMLNDKTVIRAGYGINYFPAGALGGDSARQGSGLLGYEATPTPTSSNNGITPAFYWNNGFPSFTPAPFFSSSFAAGYNPTSPNTGSTVTFDAPDISGRPPYTQNWNFNIQRDLGFSTILTVAYSASNSHWLPTGIGRGIYSNQIEPQYLALGNLLNAQATPASIAAADAIIPGLHLPYASFVGSIGQMLRPFPQYSGVSDPWGDIGNANYNSLQVSAQKRFSNGLTFLISYTLSKEIDDSGSILNGYFGASGRTAYNNALEKAVGYQDIPNQLVLSYTYQLPVGKGHSLGNGNGFVRALVSNWQVSGIQSYVEGTPLGQAPITATCDVPFTGGCYADYTPGFSGPVRINGAYGSGNILGPNPTSFIDAAAFQSPAPFTFGDTPRSLAYGLRNPPLLDEDFSLKRDIRLWENVSLRIQADVFNAFNRVVFGCIGTNITSANFGQVSCQSNTPRQFQFDASFRF